MEHAGKINARILDARSGLRVISGIYAVRMLDEGARNLFMNDFAPTIGQVIGDVVFLNSEGEHEFSGIRGFYKLQHNEFTLLIVDHINEYADEKAVGV